MPRACPLKKKGERSMSTLRASSNIGSRCYLRGILLAILCAVAVLGPSTFASAQEKVAAHGALEFREVERLRLEVGTVHEWTLDLQRGEYVEIVVNQVDVDVVIEWIDPGGESVAQYDGPEPRGPEMIGAVAESAGEFTIRVRPFGEESGDVETQWVARREASSTEVAMATVSRLHARANTSLGQRQHGEAESLWSEALEVSQRVLGPEHDYTLAVMLSLASVIEAQGRYPEAEPMYEMHLEVTRRLHGLEHASTLGSMSNVAELYWLQGRYAEAEPIFEETLEVRRRMLGSQHQYTLTSMNNLAVTYERQGRYREAEALYEGTLEVRRQLEPEAPATLTSMNNLAVLYKSQGRYRDAETLYVETVEMSWRVHGPEHPDSLNVMSNLAVAYQALGRYGDAEPLYERTLEARRRVLGTEHPRTLISMNALAELYWLQGRHVEAEPLLEETFEVRQRVLNPGHPDTLMSMNNLAYLYQSRRRYEEAERLYEEALNASRRLRGPENPVTLLSMTNVALLYSEQGRDAEAEPLLEEALKVRRRVLGSLHPDTLTSKLNLARLYDSQRHRDEAMELVDEAIDAVDPVQNAGLFAMLLGTRASFHRRADAAIDDLKEALRTIEDLRPHVGGGESTRAGWFSEYRGWYDDMVALQLEVGSTEAAIEYVERGRARTLLDQLAAGKVQLRDSIKPDLLTRLEARESEALARQAEYQQRTTLARSNKGMTEEERTAEVERLQGLLREADLEVARVNAAIKNASPLWRDTLTSGGRTIGVRDIQRFVLADGGVMLMYQIGEDNSYVLVVPQRGKAAAYELTVSDEAASVLDIESGALSEAALNDLIGGSADGESPAGIVSLLSGQSRSLSLGTGSGVQDTARLASVLQVLLPAEIRDEVMSAKEVVVVPDGVLHQIAFEALVIDTAQKPVYWLDGGPPVRYTASATVLYNIERRPSRSVLAGDDGAPTLSVADPVFDVQELIAAAEAPALEAEASGTDATRASGDPPDLAELTRRSYERAGGVLARLPGTRRESEALARVFGSSRVESITGAQATETRVRERLPAKRYLHFGTHGLVDERRNSMFSALALTPPAEETASADNDGYLQLHEIYGLPLENAELAVLSACETNVGEQVDGEGVFALSRGFLAAGAQWVVASQWAVNDESTAVLIGAFFENVRKQEQEARGIDYAAALRDAKRTVRNQPKHPEWTDPYYWAPFILTGKR